MTHILILTADAGFGHRSAANALGAAAAALSDSGVTFEIANPLSDPRLPALVREGQSDYDRIVRSAPALYRLGYDVTAETIPNALIEGGAAMVLYDAFKRLLTRRPDVIIVTFPLYLSPLSFFFALHPPAIPVITVVTDLSTLHRLWFNRKTTAMVVPTESAKLLALEHGIPRERIQQLGIPVHPRIAEEHRNPFELRAELGWRQDLFTVLAVGSVRAVHLPDIVHILNHSGLPIQLAIAAGGDKERYARYRATDWHCPAYVYDFTDNLPMMMRASDVILSKAGGLTVAESLACGLPMLLSDVIPGQETGNAEYILEYGAGRVIREPVEALEQVCHWLADAAQFAQMRAGAAHLGKPDAARDIIRLATECAAV